MCLQFGFVVFWRKDFGAKAADKMLVKLAPGHPETHLKASFPASRSDFEICLSFPWESRSAFFKFWKSDKKFEKSL
jgi:hypothetical protein